MSTSITDDSGGERVGEAVPVIDVLLVDDHRMVADSLASALAAQPDLVVTGIAHDAATARALIAELSPDVAVVDYRLPDADGIELATELRAASPGLRAVVLTGFVTAGLASRVRRARVDGLVFKTAPATELVTAIRDVHRGGSHFGSLDEGIPGSNLSPRELEVLGLLAHGSSVQAIASGLVLSPHTVRNHIRNIIVKLGAHSKLEAVSLGLRFGLVGLEPA